MTMPPTPPPATVACPHCGAPNAPTSQFCRACGKALPTAARTPQVVSGTGYAQTGVGQQLQADELHKQARKARGALLAVAILGTIGAVIFIAVSRSTAAQQNLGEGVATFMAIATGVMAAIFWGLYIWSRSQPLPAAIVGLVIYGTLVAINVVTHTSQLASGESRAPGGLGIGCIDVIIIVVLAQAIQAGIKHRKMMRQTQVGFPVK